MKLDKLIIAGRDIGCLVIGFGGIIHMQVTGKVSEVLLLMYAAFIGTPGYAGIRWQRRVTGEEPTPSTSSPPPSSPQEPSSSTSCPNS